MCCRAILSLFVWFACSATVFCQGTGDEGGGGGTPTNQFGYELTSTPSGPVPLGTVISAAIINIANGTPPYTYSWGKCCKPSGGPNCPLANDDAPAKSFCMNRAGIMRIASMVEDSASRSATRNLDVNVLGPEPVSLYGNPNPTSTSGPPLFQTTHKFQFRTGDPPEGQPLGTCYNNCVYEKVAWWDPANNQWPAEPQDWQLVSCPAAPADAFYYAPPLIIDVKVVTIGSEAFNNAAIGDVLGEYKQWVGLKVDKCPPDSEIRGFGPFHFKVKK